MAPDDNGTTRLTAAERAVARALADEINRFNVQTTGIDDFEELLVTETDEDGALIGGDLRLDLGQYVLDRCPLGPRRHARPAPSAAACCRARNTLRWPVAASNWRSTRTSFQAPDFYTRNGFEVVGDLPDYPVGHSKFLMRKRTRAE